LSFGTIVTRSAIRYAFRLFSPPAQLSAKHVCFRKMPHAQVSPTGAYDWEVRLNPRGSADSVTTSRHFLLDPDGDTVWYLDISATDPVIYKFSLSTQNVRVLLYVPF